MTTEEEAVRAVFTRLVDGRRLDPPSVHALLRAHRRRVVRRRTAAVASLSAVGVASGFALSTVLPGPAEDRVSVGPAADGSGGLLGSAEPSPTARCDPDASARGLAAAGNDLALLQVCLPDPAPGFPLRRAHDSTAMTSFNAGVAVPTRTFLVGVKPPITKQLGGGATESTPTGQEATVMVARAGAFPTTPDGVRAQREYTVTGTTPVRGADATVVRVDGELQIGVLVTVNGFDVAAFGSYDATPDAPVTVDQLVALIDSLQHLE